MFAVFVCDESGLKERDLNVFFALQRNGCERLVVERKRSLLMDKQLDVFFRLGLEEEFDAKRVVFVVISEALLRAMDPLKRW